MDFDLGSVTSWVSSRENHFHSPYPQCSQMLNGDTNNDTSKCLTALEVVLLFKHLLKY